MLEKIRSRLGFKLFFMLTVIIILAVVPLTYSAINLFKRYGNEAAALNQKQFVSLSRTYLHEITHEKAQRHQEFFDRITSSAALLGSQASSIYSNLPLYSASPFQKYHFTQSPLNGIHYNSPSDPVVTAYWGKEKIPPSAQMEIDALSHMTPLFQRILEENPEALASHAILNSGIGQYCTYSKKSKEQVFNLPPYGIFDLRQGEPMTIHMDANDRDKKVRWTNIYKDDVIEGFMLTASAPIYDRNGTFSGITGIDIPLDTVTNDVINHDSRHIHSSLTLTSFLIGKNGQVIALPEKFYSLFGLNIDRSIYSHSNDSLDLQLFQSPHSEVKELARHMSENDEWFSKINLGNEIYYVSSTRMKKHGWIVGLITREADLLSSIDESKKTLTGAIRLLEIRGAALSLLSVITAVLVIFLLLKHLITPVRNLADATRRVAEGDLSVRSSVATSDEIGLLARSFNTMVGQLEKAHNEQVKYADSLKNKVMMSSSELVKQKAKLENAISLLKKEEKQRQLVAEALYHSQQQYYDTLESTTSGAFIIEEGILTYVNKAFADDIFLAQKEDLIGLNPINLITEKDRYLVASNMRKRFAGEEVPPYVITYCRDDGTERLGEVWAKLSTWQGKNILVGTITDVTHYKKQEQQIQAQDKQLKQSLLEKEALLKEVYHRTKNNMLVIISMLDLQAQELKDGKLQAIFKETENRIRTMALVHEKLYQSKNLSRIDMGSYLHELGESILSTMVFDNRIQLQCKFATISVNIDYAVPLGLVVNEIITNAIKHAFPNSRRGNILIAIERQQNRRILLTVADDGIGLPGDIDPLRTDSFGIGIIISSLVQMQLSGNISIDRSSGTRYLISFPEPHTLPRI